MYHRHCSYAVMLLSTAKQVTQYTLISEVGH